MQYVNGLKILINHSTSNLQSTLLNLTARVKLFEQTKRRKKMQGLACFQFSTFFLWIPSFTMILISSEESCLVPSPRFHSSISQSFAWAERSSHRTHFSARFLSLSHLSLQDYYTSLVLASPLLPNKAPGGPPWAHRLTAAYTFHISHFCFTRRHITSLKMDCWFS